MAMEKAKQIQTANFGLEQKEAVVESIHKSSTNRLRPSMDREPSLYYFTAQAYNNSSYYK